jgi:hypothetical protein
MSAKTMSEAELSRLGLKYSFEGAHTQAPSRKPDGEAGRVAGGAAESFPKAIGTPKMAKAGIARHVLGRMNSTEARYAMVLNTRLAAGEISRWDFEAVTLRIGTRTTITPDFRVIMADGAEEYHEVKGGFVRDDAWVKLKVAAGLHPYRFVLAKWVKKAWDVKEVQP